MSEESSPAEEIDIATSLDQLVKTILADAKKDGVKLSDRIECLKICSQHYVNTSKVKPRKPAGDEGDSSDTPTMGDLQRRVKGDSDVETTGD